jgi:hypothetical protein
MSESYSSLTIVLEENISEERAEALTKALLLLEGVQSVSPNVSDDFAERVAESRVRHELGSKLFEILYPPSEGNKR